VADEERIMRTGWSQCFEFPSVLWHCCLGNLQLACENLCQLSQRFSSRATEGEKKLEPANAGWPGNSH